VDNTVRPAHVRTRTIQELLCCLPPSPPGPIGGLAAEPGEDPVQAPPRAVAGSGELAGSTLRLSFTQPLLTATVTRDAFTVAALRSSGWAQLEISGVELDEPGTTVTLRLRSAPRTRPVRIVAHGTGSAPLLGAEGRPLSGADVDRRSVSSGEDAAVIVGTVVGTGQLAPSATATEIDTETE
jgi:hypothetical protein